jgi:hypothetical protein
MTFVIRVGTCTQWFVFAGWCVIKQGKDDDDDDDDDDEDETGAEVDQIREFGFCRGPGFV